MNFATLGTETIPILPLRHTEERRLRQSFAQAQVRHFLQMFPGISRADRLPEAGLWSGASVQGRKLASGMQPGSDMSTNPSSPSESSDSSYSSLAQLRDEIRLKVHLASLDVKTKWHELEAKLDNFEHRITGDNGVTDATAHLAHDLKQSLVDFRNRLSHES